MFLSKTRWVLQKNPVSTEGHGGAVFPRISGRQACAVASLRLATATFTGVNEGIALHRVCIS